MSRTKSALKTLRSHAVARSLFPRTTLQGAIDDMGFVQADPIRSPARAQDLILRHRVRGYRAGDLERQYASLDVEEDYLYAYGFLSRQVWQLLHPRRTPPLRAFEKKVLATVNQLGEAHPRMLESHLGKRRIVNDWGGYSKATTHALEWLHWRGILRIARRETGIRIYRPAILPGGAANPDERLRALIMNHAGIFSPSPEKSLQTVIARYRELGNTRRTLSDLIGDGTLQKQTVDGVSYVWPSTDTGRHDASRRVRFLAPFDPVVWDRARFEHLWGWPYRFEAYTPLAKRVRGYYAMPLLWRDDVVGWANVTGATGATGAPSVEKTLDVSVGFVDRRPRERDFGRELDAEIARLEAFLDSN